MLRRPPTILRHLASQLSTVADPHAVLGIAKGATKAEVKAAYREKAKATHPDVHSADDREAAEMAFKDVSAAFIQLSGSVPRRPRAGMTKEDAEEMFWEIFGADGDVELAWRVPGRRAPQAPKSWQQYQALLESDTYAPGPEARALYRECLRALRGVDEATAAGVNEHARMLFTAHAHETDKTRIRTLLVDARHSLDEMSKCLGTAVTADTEPPPTHAPTKARHATESKQL